MERSIINFNIKKLSTDDMTLRVNLFMDNINKMDVVHLYRGKSKVSNLDTNIDFKEDKDFVHFNTSNSNSFELTYDVKLGFLAKHGHYGYITDTTVAFAGEQVLLLPFEALNLASDKNIFTFDINVTFDFNTNKIIPFNKNNSTYVHAKTWGDMFELMKSSYIFSNLNLTKINNNFNLYSNFNIEAIHVKNLNKLYNYYSNLFKIEIPLNITSLLDNNLEYGIFAGSSCSNICASFDFTKKRDYQLIAHRMFHAFMDSKLDNHVFHMPPNLWVTEGLAGIYEHKALEILDENFKKELNISFDEEFKKLYRIYLYSITKNEKLYNFPPLLEGNLNSHALIEYLHYNKAPILIKFFEDNSPIENEDKFINYLLSLESLENFSQPDMFKAILQDKTNEFAIDYIFGAKHIIYDIDLKGDISIIREELTNFEKTMSTWFELDKVKNDSLVTNEDLKIFS